MAGSVAIECLIKLNERLSFLGVMTLWLLNACRLSIGCPAHNGIAIGGVSVEMERYSFYSSPVSFWRHVARLVDKDASATKCGGPKSDTANLASRESSIEITS